MQQNDVETDLLSEETLLTAISSVYDLPDPVTCAPFSSGLNDVYEVTTGGATHFLKVYRAGWRTQDEVLQETAALFHLIDKGVRVALPVARRDGAFAWTLTLPDCERQVMLLACAPGNVIYSPDESCCHLFGQTMAEVHNATDDFADAPVRYDLENLLASPLHSLERWMDDHPNDDAFLRGLIGRLQTQIENLPPGARDWGYCHGDFRPANLHLEQETGAVTTFDFELGGIGFRAYDLAYTQTTIHHMALELLWRAPVLENHEQCWAAFLQGYAERRPLHDADLDAIPLFVALRPIQIMGTLLQTAWENPDGNTWPPSEAGGIPGGDLFDRALQFLRAWDKEYLQSRPKNAGD